MFYTAIETSWGWVAVLASPSGIRRLALSSGSKDQAIEELATGGRAGCSDSRFTGLSEKLRAYFAGKPVYFDERLDLDEYSLFMRSVWKSARRIGYGKTASYADIALDAGSALAFRAVGQAMKRNPVPLIIPCHRIIRSDGSTGGFFGGECMKRDLLELERRGSDRLPGG